jgi:hypothetical protein
MKLFAILLGATASLFLSGCDFANHSNSQSLTIKRSESKFSLEATFNPRKLPKVMAYLEKSLGEPKLFSGPKDFRDSEVNLGDTLKFDMRVSSNSIVIKFRKMENSFNSYRKLESTCREFKKALN